MITLLILLSLCTLICSDTALSRFEYLRTYNADVNVALSSIAGLLKVVHKVNNEGIKTPDDSLFDGSTKSCAEQCLLTKFSCRYFAAVAIQGEMQCIMSTWEFLSPEYFPNVGTEDFPRALIVGAYQCVSHFDTRGLCYSIKEKIDNVKEISKAPTLLREEKFNELLQGYGFSKLLNKDMWNNMRTLLTASLNALVVPKTTTSNFIDWVNGVESSGPQSKDSPSGEPSLKHTRLGSNAESKLLTDIELFIRGVNRNVKTLYDRENKVLFVGSSEVQFLANATIDDTLFWTYSAKGLQDNVIYRGCRGELNGKQIPWGDVRELHIKAAARLGHDVNKLSGPMFEGDVSFWYFLCQLTGPWDCGSHNVLHFTANLVQVVSILNGKPQMTYTESFPKSFPGEHVDIITHRK